MESLYARILSVIGAEQPSDDDSRDDLPPELLPTTAERVEMERTEGSHLLAAWRESCGGVPPGVSTDVVVAGCGAVRAHIERLLRDAEQNQGARLECQPGHDPYLEIKTRRTSRLGRTAAWSTEDLVTLRVPADAFAAHVARRLGVGVDTGMWLWRKIFEAMTADHAFQYLFQGLDLAVLPDGAVCVRL
jgi:hypothetical protein